MHFATNIVEENRNYVSCLYQFFRFRPIMINITMDRWMDAAPMETERNARPRRKQVLFNGHCERGNLWWCPCDLNLYNNNRKQQKNDWLQNRLRGPSFESEIFSNGIDTRTADRLRWKKSKWPKYRRYHSSDRSITVILLSEDFDAQVSNWKRIAIVGASETSTESAWIVNAGVALIEVVRADVDAI